MHDTSLSWRDGQPYSDRYGDVYFSRDSGIAETRHVFLDQNRLATRWAALQQGEIFAIGETGFGTGLNFLCAWRLWKDMAPPGAILHYVSTELHPIAPDDLRQSLALWPELEPLAAQLLDQYGTLSPGWHRMVFARDRVVLTLLIGDANETLPRLDARIDAWFLDGFAPARNPDMWSDPVFQAIASCSAPDATFATFTSAGAVKRGLVAAGFRVEKVPGYGRKRDMLRGEIATDRPAMAQLSGREAVVIGGGLAGCATAHSLAIRGWRVTLVERHPTVAAEASGNHQGILYARISPRRNALSEFALAGYQHAVRNLALLMPQGESTWQQCGLLQLAFDEDEALRLAGVAKQGLPSQLLHEIDQTEAGRLAGIPVPFGGLYFPGGGWVNPPALCRALLEAVDVTVMPGREATHLCRGHDSWSVLHQGELLAQAPVVVVACAVHSNRFEQTAHLPLRSIRGQVTHLPANPQSSKLRTVLCGEGYAAPQRGGMHTIGATYGNLEESVELRAVDHAENLAMLAQMSPELHQALGCDTMRLDGLDGRAACRCNVPDYLPLVGRVSSGLPGLYVNTGHGSRGLITTMLSAETLASQMGNEPSPVPSDLVKAMTPQRFSRKSRH